ncbi:MAG TPA: CHAT domain-containing protein [Gemmatimonadota bacterium]|nr:CHAT domain-containing protein [Gemmatimonadota bacterium]
MRRWGTVLGIGGVALGALALTIIVRDSPDPIEGTADPPAAMSALDSLIAAGEPLYWDGDFEGAREVFRDAHDRALSAGDSAARANALTWLGLAAFRLGEYDEARSLGESALALKLRLDLTDQLPRSYNALGLLALSEGRLTDAADLFQKTAEASRAVEDQETLAKASNNLGLVYTDLGEFVQARRGFEESVRAAREIGDPLIEGRALSNLGMLESRLGNPLAAIGYFEDARLRYRESEDVTGEQHTLGQLGVAYAALGEPRRAIAVLDSALAQAREQGLRQEEASDLEQIGEIHGEAGDHRRALTFYRQAAEINADLGLAIETGVDLRREAQSYAALGDREQASALADRALESHRAAGAPVDAMEDLLVLADLEPSPAAAWQRLEEARELALKLDSRAARLGVALAEARVADKVGEPDRALASLARAEPDLATASYLTLAEAEGLRARAHARMGRLPLAAAAGRRAIAAVERARGGYASGLLRTTLLNDRRAVYSGLVDVLIDMGKVEEAFEVADASRGRALLEHLAHREPEGRIPASSYEEGERLLREVDGLATLLSETEAIPPDERDAEHATTVAGLARRLADARARYESLTIHARERDPAFAVLGGQQARTREVQAALGPGEALIEYYVTPERVQIFLVTPKEVSLQTRSITSADLARQVRLARELTGSARPGTGPDPDAILRRLHAELLAPVVESGALTGVTRLIVVPHDMLVYVPFAALRSGKTGRYAAEDFVMLDVPSAGALPALRRDAAVLPDRPRTLAIVPFPEDLPGSATEGEAIDRSHDRVSILKGEEATEEAVRQALSSQTIVHVASHGALNLRNPLFSRIELFRSVEGNPADDGRLEVHEILDFRIQSPLVFLSGCETGVGEAWSSGFARGEDYATLATAFLYAGAGSVVATLWRIDDRGAAELATRFYGHLRNRSPAEALALAQRDLLRSEAYRRPYYWAGYRISGDERSSASRSVRGEREAQNLLVSAFHGSGGSSQPPPSRHHATVRSRRTP